ncbi:MAG TPA: Gfo/Idh/MocA family oxidoreductase [Phycisphaerae bacterium]|nr:Gfo/Idh/MocA family oxidoreductase [Phycisphaerae bacterium]HOJ73333.1 Gfo/Idh/MocA family oxidoreductase [Phycisphaerae bacterium]HOM50941.1 Gfo/Idh/MocA family oxidoreductase [Phycisphaerae bacterium]HON66682.1 Gfo/Idh/MocA family oxidoreductase [Phycisphaerae bacterium]HOQ84433.1 Gfo/Idh/MocA family oxidoreductase [Phycisphaerae bacterium]
MKSRTLRIGFIGTGDVVTRFHLPGWARLGNVEYVAAADVREERVREVADRYGIPQVFTDYRRLLDLKGIDAVDVCVPNRLHGPVTLAALAAGKHVLCEKPLATTPAEVEAVIAAGKAAGRLVCVMKNHRYRGITRAIKRWIDEGNLGQPYYARAWALRRNLLPCAPGFVRKELSGGGVCMDMGVHCLDVVLHLLDFPEPVRVTGHMGTFLAKSDAIPGGWGEWDRGTFDVEDFACAMVRFESDLTLSLETSWLAHIPEQETISCTILGSKAGVSWPSGVVATARERRLMDVSLEPLPELECGHWSVIEEFADAVVNGKPSPVPPEESLKVVRILEGVYESQRQQREVAV